MVVIMTIFEKMKTSNIDDIVEWLDEYASFGNSPWDEWFIEHHCDKCESIEKDGMDFAWCEVHGNCTFFTEMKDSPDNKQVIKMWLESEAD